MKNRELLTEKRLLKFGFLKSTWNEESKIPCFIKRRLVIFDEKDEFDVRIETKKGQTAFIRFVKYVDELQSLYPHLTGEELTDYYFTEEDIRQFYYLEHGESHTLDAIPPHEAIGLMAESLDLEYDEKMGMWA